VFNFYLCYFLKTLFLLLRLHLSCHHVFKTLRLVYAWLSIFWQICKNNILLFSCSALLELHKKNLLFCYQDYFIHCYCGWAWVFVNNLAEVIVIVSVSLPDVNWWMSIISQNLLCVMSHNFLTENQCSLHYCTCESHFELNIFISFGMTYHQRNAFQSNANASNVMNMLV